MTASTSILSRLIVIVFSMLRARALPAGPSASSAFVRFATVE